MSTPYLTGKLYRIFLSNDPIRSNSRVGSSDTRAEEGMSESKFSSAEKWTVGKRALKVLFDPRRSHGLSQEYDPALEDPAEDYLRWRLS